MQRKCRRMVIALLLTMAFTAVIQSQAVIQQAVLVEMTKMTGNGALITEWPLIQGVMNFPAPLRHQLALSDAELAAALSSETNDERTRIRRHLAKALGLTEGLQRLPH